MSAHDARRAATPSLRNPRVTAVVPNYNHARYLAQRLDSILNQTYANIDVILLDDGSTDASADVIADYCDRYPDRVRAILNQTNSGRVFKQWHKGVEAAQGDLVWICESDDFCEPDFVERLVPHFEDRSVTLAFGRIQRALGDGTIDTALDDYREGAERGIWSQACVRPAATWFARSFGKRNVIPNVGGCIWRNQTLPPDVWAEAGRYKVLGDWFLYLHIAGSGQICFEPEAVAYYRIHGGNLSSSEYSNPEFYREPARLMTSILQRWNVPRRHVKRFIDRQTKRYAAKGLADAHGPITQYLDGAKLRATQRTTNHVLITVRREAPEQIATLSADYLAQGWLVSLLLAGSPESVDRIADVLSPATPIYSATPAIELDVARLVLHAGVTHIHPLTSGGRDHGAVDLRDLV